MNELYALILAGGSGTRLWPMSRQASPKQLISLGRELSLFQETVSRIRTRIEPERMIFVTSRELAGDIRDHLRRLLGEKSNGCIIVAEPLGRNTAPAILLGARIVQARDPKALLLVAPSDHIIQDTPSFIQAIENSLDAAASGMVVTYGITPTRPETGYGYIKAGEKEGNVYRVERFEEKPDAVRAEELLKDKNYTWNSGIFLFSVKSIMEEAEKYLPVQTSALKNIDPETLDGLDEAYSGMEPMSIDHGIMEKTDRAAVIPVSMGWSDLGSWDSFYEMREKESSGNVVSGDVFGLENEDCLILGEGKFLAVSGMKDTIVVQTEDATLICPRGRSQNVRHIVAHLEEQGRSERLVHLTVRRPWGSYTVLTESDLYKVKRLSVDPHQKMSLQKHERRSEHWVVVKGEVIVTLGEDQITLKANEGITIPIGTLHRIENPGEETAELVEVQLGDYVGEDDIVRFDDDYGRAK
ncbi:MAG: mannose-1-phosphate guanylyltransferase/mannose-6-phosphate isomerase [bacterium]|nr:mannose-1-phosphate guanylyltransferase/mannose-6-phosphate isomerase [bacterium]MDT8366581.1 mannose-1-phosphate guanylyltransferase/mannose-6-phosphate isomerase [bacterium]